jgi:hypothetical protein
MLARLMNELHDRDDPVATLSPPMDDELVRKQRELADLIVRHAPMDDIRMAVAMGAKVTEPVVQGTRTHTYASHSSTGLRPLHYATYANNTSAVRYLLLRGCDVDAVDDCGYTASMFANIASLGNSHSS